jgi:hypothetical protein
MKGTSESLFLYGNCAEFFLDPDGHGLGCTVIRLRAAGSRTGRRSAIPAIAERKTQVASDVGEAGMSGSVSGSTLDISGWRVRNSIPSSRLNGCSFLLGAVPASPRYSPKSDVSG